MAVLDKVLNVLPNQQSIVNPLNKLSDYQASMLEKEGYDLDWLKEIQPRGGIEFNENGYSTSDGYNRVLKVYDYANDTGFFWLAYLMNNLNTLSALDIATGEKDEVIRKINYKLNELEEAAEKERKATDRNDSVADYQELTSYALDLTREEKFLRKLF